MRCVDLTRTAPALGEAEALRVQKLTGHLWARLMELEEDGLRVLSPTDPKAGSGEVRVQFPAGEGRTAVQRLGERYGVRCTAGAQGDVCFALGPDTTFEALDYVQDAVYRYLLQSS